MAEGMEKELKSAGITYEKNEEKLAQIRNMSQETAKQLAKADSAANAGQSRAAVGPKISIAKDARNIRKLLRASVSLVAESCKQRITEVTAVSRLHLHNCLVVLEEHTHRVIVRLIRLG